MTQTAILLLGKLASPLKGVAEPTQHSQIPIWVDWLAQGLTLLGLVIALVQLFRTNGATKHARKVLEDATEGLYRTQAIAAIVDTKAILLSIETALADKNREALRRELSSYSMRANEIVRYLEQIDEDTTTLSDLLQESAIDASNGLNELDADKGVDLVATPYLREVITGIRGVVPRVHGLSALIASKPLTTMKKKKVKQGHRADHAQVVPSSEMSSLTYADVFGALGEYSGTASTSTHPQNKPFRHGMSPIAGGTTDEI